MFHVMTRARIVEKWSKEGVKKDGSSITYYNVKIADPARYESETISVSEDVFNKIEPKQDVMLFGYVGRYGQNTSVRFTEIFDPKKHFQW